MRRFQTILISLILGAWFCFTIGYAFNGADTWQTEGDVAIISRNLLFAGKDKANVRLSPDGTMLSYLSPVEGVLNIFVAPVDDPGAARQVTFEYARGITSYIWAFTGEHILYNLDEFFNQSWHVFSVNVHTNERLDLTPIRGVDALMQEVSPLFPDEILIGLRDRSPHYDVYRVNLLNGEREQVLENRHFFAVMSNNNFEAPVVLAFNQAGDIEVIRSSDVKPVTVIPLMDKGSTRPLTIDKTGQILYLLDSRSNDTATLVALDMETRGQTVVAKHPTADITKVLFHPSEQHPLAVSATYAHKTWQVLDEELEDDFEYLQGLETGDLDILSQSQDNSRWLVAYLNTSEPLRYYLYDRDAGEADLLFSQRPALENYTLAEMQSLVLEARDGLNLVSYLTLPAWTDADADARPSEALPMVLYVHGGPWDRNRLEFDPWHQWLANRGYAVLSVNFRGSAGFGKAFLEAGNLEWGGKMQDDLIDAVNWAINEGIADPERVAIMGGSYGGYAALVGLSMTPETFACGVDIAGPSNLVSFIATIPPHWRPEMTLWTTRVGNPALEDGYLRLREQTPLWHINSINKPLLIGQGAEDGRVQRYQSDQFVLAMLEQDIPVTYVLYPDEGHQFARLENTISFNAVTEAFLGQCLGGRVEPIANDFAGSSLTILTGADLIPELEQSFHTEVCMNLDTRITLKNWLTETGEPFVDFCAPGY